MGSHYIRVRGTRGLALAAVLTLTAALPSPHAVAKRADTAKPVISEVAITPLQVELAAKNSGTTPVAISVRVVDASAIDRVVAGLYDRAATKGRAVELRRVTGTTTDGVWTAEARLPNIAERGTWQVRAFAVDVFNNSTDPDAVVGTFAAHHGARFNEASFGPRQAKPGDELVIAGALQRFRPGLGWVGYDDRRVRLEFRAKDAAKFVAVAVGRSAKDGTVAFKKVTVKQGGAWRISFAGNSGYAAARSGADPVAVPVPGEGADKVTTTSLPGDQPEH